MTTAPQNTAAAMTVQLNREIFDAIAKQRGWSTDAAIAKAVGVSRQQAARILDGTQPPTAAFIAGFLTAVPEAGFRRSFDIVPTSDHPKEVTTK